MITIWSLVVTASPLARGSADTVPLIGAVMVAALSFASALASVSFAFVTAASAEATVSVP
jgi:hypothetical protein